jgi:dipeptidyl aminopeptidase/acylaminoacyl peptidase
VFTFDRSPTRNRGKSELGKDIDLGYGQSVHVSRVTYNLTDGAQAWLSFEMESETGVNYAGLLDKAHPLTGAGGGGGGSISTGPFTSDVYYLESLPPGPLTVDIIGITANLPGHWEAAWTPPAPQTQTLPTPQPSAFLTRESWQQALQAQSSLPTGLSGTLALADVPPPDYYYQVSVAKLDGSSKSIGFGSAPSLSPDRTRVVYMGPAVDGPADGLYITDLASNTSLLPGTTRGDMNPLWSPDGQTIAFTRGPSSGLIGAPGPYNIVVTNVDGSDFRQLTEGTNANYAMAWMPDGNRLLYTVASRDGAFLHIMDIQSGEISPLFDRNYNGTVVVSPDGKRLAFEEMLPLDKYGLFISDLDGSNRKLLADGDLHRDDLAEPDGNWVASATIQTK